MVSASGLTSSASVTFPERPPKLKISVRVAVWRDPSGDPPSTDDSLLASIVVLLVMTRTRVRNVRYGPPEIRIVAWDVTNNEMTLPSGTGKDNRQFSVQSASWPLGVFGIIALSD